MADVNSVFYTIEGDRLKLINKIIIGLAVVSSIVESDVTGSIAVLGIMAVICGNLELLLAYLFLNPFSIICDITRLALQPPNWFLIIVDILEMIFKLGGLWFAWSLWSNRDSGNYQSYVQEGGMHGVTQQQGGDPFSSYAKPPNANQDDGNAAL